MTIDNLVWTVLGIILYAMLGLGYHKKQMDNVTSGTTEIKFPLTMFPDIVNTLMFAVSILWPISVLLGLFFHFLDYFRPEQKGIDR